MSTEESRQLLESAARLAAEKGLVRFTRFLDPAELHQAQSLARAHGAAFASFGGYDRAERRIGCFYPAGEAAEESAYPIACLHSRYASRFCSLSHRDLLGAFMALGLTRSCIGDMIISGEDVYLFAHESIADYLVASMTSAGRASLSFRALDTPPAMPEPDGVSFSAIVSSLRLDAVLAGAYRLSRAQAQEVIRSGLVKVNHLPCDRVDAAVAEDTLLSLRGKGRVRLVSIDGTTRKQRIGLTFFRYE